MNFDRTQFAANVVAVVTADGVLNPLELAQCEIIKKHYKYTKTEWAKGERLAGTPGFALKPTGTFADKVMNVEAMLRVAYADGDAAECEVKLIMDFCVAIGITQEQLDSLNADVVKDVLQDPIVCPFCGSEVAHGSSFCPSCGTKLAVDAGVKTSFDIPPEGLTITFSESTASTFGDALALAKETSAYQEIERSKKKWYLASFSWDDMRWRKMVECVSGMRNKEVYDNGEPKDWYSVFSWKLMDCLRRRDTAYDKSTHCFCSSSYGDGSGKVLNPWGCACLQLAWNEYGNSWMRFGRWEKNLMNIRWVFDKERIRHAFMESAKDVRRCPYFVDSMEKVLAALSDSVCPVRDKAWKFHAVYDELVPGAITVNIRNEYGVEKIKSDGPEPADLSVFSQIMRSVYGEAQLKAVLK